MANKKISELNPAEPVSSEDLLAIVQNINGTPETRKVKAKDLQGNFNEVIPVNPENSIRVTLTDADISSGQYELNFEEYQSFILETESGEMLPYRNFLFIATGNINYNSLYFFSFPTGASRFMIKDSNNNYILGSALTVGRGTIIEATPIVDDEWMVRSLNRIQSKDGSIIVSQTSDAVDLRVNPQSLNFVNTKNDVTGSFSSETRIIRVPRNTKGLVISLYSAVYYSKVNTYQEFIIEGDLPIQDIVQTKIVDKSSWSGNPNAHSFIFSVNDDYIDIIANFGRNVNYKPRVLFNPNNVVVNMDAVANYPYQNVTYVPHPFFDNQSSVDKYADLKSNAGSGQSKLRRIAKIPVNTSSNSISTVIISLYAKAYTGTGGQYDWHALGYKAYEEIIIDTTQENIYRDEVVQTTIGGSIVYWQITNNTYVEVYLQNASGASNYYVTRVLFNPNKTNVDLSQEDVNDYYYLDPTIKKAKNIYDYKQNAIDQTIDHSINNGNKSIVGAINWLAQQIGQGGGGSSTVSSGAESYPFTLTDGGINLNNEFRAVRFTPLANFTATKAQLNMLANHTSQTFEIAIYDVTSGNKIATTGTINFAGSTIGLRTEPLQQAVQLQAGTLYMLALFVTGNNRYVGARRFVSALGGQNMDYIIQGSTTAAPNTISDLSIQQRYPGNISQIDMPYLHVF
jgi:hypothetical protein